MPVTRHNGCGFPPVGRALPRDVKVAIDYMRQNITWPIRIADLLAATGASERTLRKHFRIFLGVAPLDFLRRLRLAAAREALLTSSGYSVSEIAIRVGFTHFGRFSSDYRRCFGELPSATRRREVRFEQPGDPPPGRGVSGRHRSVRRAARVRPGSTGLHGKLAASYVRVEEQAAARDELAILRRILPDGVSARQYANSFPCDIDSFKNPLVNSLTEIGMPP